MNERDEQADSEIAARAKIDFDQSVDALDASTLSRLNRGRQAALAELNAPKRAWLQWMPAAGLATAVLLAVVMFRGPGDAEVIGAPASDFEIVMSEERFEMLEELEFYSWLATQELTDEGDLG